MAHRETESPLIAKPELWDGQPDLELGQGYLQDVCLVLADTAMMLRDAHEHPEGSIHAFEERIADIQFKGWMLHRAPIFNSDMALTVGHNPHVVQMYALSGFEFADGAKAVLGDEGVRAMPQVREQFIFIDRRSDRSIDFVRRFTYDNIISTRDTATQNEVHKAVLQESRADMDKFTIYSLYKINKLLDGLRADGRLA